LHPAQPSLLPVIVDDAERLAALRSYNILDTAEEQDFDELTTLASVICQVPIALISLVDAERQWFKSHKGLDINETPVEQSFCAHAIASYDDILVVNDAREDERFADNPLVIGGPKIVFYAGIPLVNEDGYALGSLCVIDNDRKQLTHEQTQALKILAKQVVDKLELRRKIVALEKTNQDLLDANVFIQKFASMAAHDIKNPLSTVLLTAQALKLRVQKLEDEGCARLIDMNIASTKNLLVLVDEMLTYSQQPELLLAKKQQFDITDKLKKLLNIIHVPVNFEIILPAVTPQIEMSLIAFEQIFTNLISNAIRYNDKEKGNITINFTDTEGYYRFEVKDNGTGIAEEYHEKIFHNNFTLKVTDRYNKKGTGIGLSTVKELVKALKGTIHVKSILGEGTNFFITIKK
jgi:signal transduction histidine kinase